MKQYVFRYNLMVQDMSGGGINPTLSSCNVYIKTSMDVKLL